ncbi:MAG TPA: glucose 1-dehydrogenase [Chloroflexota bacterium]|nr:glucose 1-dehydrogenase [Chloroflexota bacterium]
MNSLELFRLDGRVAIVTGGGRGIGRWIAETLAGVGATVVICARKLPALEETAQAIEAKGGSAVALGCDVTSEEDVHRVVDEVRRRFGRLDILVNNSGAGWTAPPEEMPRERFERVLEVNVTGSFLMAQAAAPLIMESGGGRIINLASIAALVGGRPGYFQAAGYAASKGALIAMTRDLATSWAAQGITVNALAPGWFPTDMSTPILDRHGDSFLRGIPLRRFGGPDDLRGPILLLASDAGAYITGQVIVVDGGLTAW